MSGRRRAAALLVGVAVALVPAPAHTDDVRVDGRRLQYAVLGPADAPAVVLVHGLVSSSRDWRFVHALLAAERRVVAFDRPGNGGSDPLDDYGVPRQVATLAALADALSLPRFACVGHAYGGSICLAFALEHPERVTALVLVGTNGIPFRLPAVWRAALALRGAGFDTIAQALFRRPAVGRQLVANRYAVASAPGDPVPAALVEAEYEDLRGNGLRPLFEEIRTWDDRPTASRLDRIAAPTLVLAGRRDRYYMAPRWISEELARRIPGARLVEVDAWANLPHVSDPEGFAARVRAFLTDVGA